MRDEWIDLTSSQDTMRRYLRLSSLPGTTLTATPGPAFWPFGTILRRVNRASADRLLVVRDDGNAHFTAIVLSGLRDAGHMRSDWARRRWEPE